MSDANPDDVGAVAELDGRHPVRDVTGVAANLETGTAGELDVGVDGGLGADRADGTSFDGLHHSLLVRSFCNHHNRLGRGCTLDKMDNVPQKRTSQSSLEHIVDVIRWLTIGDI